MDQLALAACVPEPGVVLDRIEADRDDEIGLVEQAIRRLIVEQADAPAETVEPVTRDDAGSLIGTGNRQPRARQQPAHAFGDGTLARQHAQQDHRPFGRIDQPGGFGNRFGVGSTQPGHGRRCEDRTGSRRLHHVFWQAEKGGTRPAGFGSAEGGGDGLGDGRRRIDLGGVLGDGAQQCHRVHALVCLLQTVGDGHRAAQSNHRIAFGVGRGESGGEIGDAGA